MSGAVVLFVIFALIAILSAVMVISSANPVHSAIWLILNLVCIAVLYLTLNASFLMAVQLIVYAGAIVVLFLFVVMVLSPRKDDAGHAHMPWLRPLGLAAAALMFAAFVWMLKVDSSANAVSSVHGGPAEIGRLLYTKYLLPFEATSILLLVALVGALYLGRRSQDDNAPDAVVKDNREEVQAHAGR